MADIWIALSVTCAATIAVNLGLGEAISKVVEKILSCYVCTTFWVVLCSLWIFHNSTLEYAIVLSLYMAYLSNYVAIILSYLNKLHDYLWQRSNKQK